MTYKTCRICGKEYEACTSLKKEIGVFKYQDVSCSPECGAIYLEQIISSRTKKPFKPTKDKKEVVELKAKKRDIPVKDKNLREEIEDIIS